MKNYKSIFIALVFISYYFIGLPTIIYAQTTYQLRLEGLELAKGINLTNTFRVGTIFAGEAFDNKNKIGRWTAVLSHRGTENIEVCNGVGDIVTMRLTINFNSGDQLVLGMADLKEVPDVYWDFSYVGDPCSLGGLVCDTCEVAETIGCDSGGSSDLATVEPITLKPKSGSTINVKDATLYEGRLCHYYPLIPRVSALLEINR